MTKRRPLLVLTTLLAMTFATASVRADGDAPAPVSPAPPSAEEPHGDPIADEARARIRRGLELYDEGDYRLALIEFERAYKILPNYKILYNLGQVHFQLGEYARAHATLTQYLQEGGQEIPVSRRADVETDLSALMKRIAALKVVTNVEGAEITFDDRPVGVAPLPRTLVDAGSIRVVASKPGYTTTMRVVTLAGGDELVVRLELAKALPLYVPPSSGSDRLSGVAVGSWIVTGVLVAGAIGTGVAAGAASSRFDTMRAAPIQGSPEQAQTDLNRQGNLVDALALTTDALIVSSIIAGGVSLYLTLRRPTTKAQRTVPSVLGWSF